MDPGAVLLALLGSPNLASRRAVFEQYDSTVQAATIAGPGHGAAVLRVTGTSKALVAATDGNAGVSAADPWLGAAMSVAEAARNVAITGARPLGVTNCLNFGDPTRPDAFWQLSEAVRGLGDACRALDLPVTGGNVSLYNESARGRIQPTPQIGVVGLLDDAARAIGPAFRRADDVVLLIGRAGPGLVGSEYAARRRPGAGGRPAGPGPGSRAAAPGVRDRGRCARTARFRPGRVRRRVRRRPRKGRGVGRASAHVSACRSRARPPSTSSARARAGLIVSARPSDDRCGGPPRDGPRPPRRGNRRRGRPTAHRGARERRRDRRRGGARLARRGRHRRAHRGPGARLGAGVAPRSWGGPPDVRRVRRLAAARLGHGGCSRGGHGPVRAPAPRPGIGRHRGQRWRQRSSCTRTSG